MRVLAAMSGGVDSAVAAARAAEAGHDVTGVHLALSSNPASFRTGARGCCTLEDARDARRAADVIGIPFYVWDLAERFRADVVDDFVAEYAAGRTPNPCLRCNEKIKFSAVLDKALALGFDAVCTGHYARVVDGRLHRAVDPAKDQSYVLGVLTARQVGHAMFPLGDTPKDGGTPGGRPPRAGGRRQAGQPRHLLHRRRRHRRVPAAPARVPSPAPSSTAPACSSASTTAPTRSPSGSGRDCASAHRHPTESPATSSTCRLSTAR